MAQAFHYNARATITLVDGTVLRRSVTDYVICEPTANLEQAVISSLMDSSEPDEVPVAHVTLHSLQFFQRVQARG